MSALIIDLNRITKAEFEGFVIKPNGKLTDEDTAYLISKVVVSWPYEAEISEAGFFDLPLLDSLEVENRVTEAMRSVEMDDQIEIDLNQVNRHDFNQVAQGLDPNAVGRFMAKVIVSWPYDMEICEESFMELGLADSKAIELAVQAKIEAMRDKSLGKPSTSPKRYKRRN